LSCSEGTVVLRLGTDNQQKTANQDGANTDPDRGIDGLLFIDGHVKRAHVDIVCLFRVGKAAIRQP